MNITKLLLLALLVASTTSWLPAAATSLLGPAATWAPGNVEDLHRSTAVDDQDPKKKQDPKKGAGKKKQARPA